MKKDLTAISYCPNATKSNQLMWYLTGANTYPGATNTRRAYYHAHRPYSYEDDQEDLAGDGSGILWELYEVGGIKYDPNYGLNDYDML